MVAYWNVCLVPRFVLVRIDDPKRLFCMPLTNDQCLVYFSSKFLRIASKFGVTV